MAEAVPVFAETMPSIRKVELDRPWRWLAKGWEDFRAQPSVGLAYGLLAAVTGYLITWGLWTTGYFYLALPLAAGFLIVGPILTVGLYEASRRREQGLTTTLADALTAFRRNTSQIGLMGVALLLLMFAWARLAAMIFMLYYGMMPPSLQDLVVNTFLAPEALPFLVFGTAVGAALALLAFAISVVSVPMLLDRPDANVITAIATSWRAMQTNTTALLLWAALIVLFVGAGLATLYLGLIVALPLIGHASWHAYRDLVIAPASA